MKQKIAVGSMVFIYHFEQTEPFFPLVQKIFSAAQAGNTELITSVISVAEALSAPKYLELPEIVKEIDLFFKEADFLSVYSFDWEIAHEVTRLRRENKSVRMPDAIQLATAVVGGASVFLTNDIKLTKLKFDSLEIRMVDEFEV